MKEEKKSIREELEEHSPLLARMKDKQQEPFQVPEHYFHQLTNQVMERVSLEPRPARRQTNAGWADWLRSVFTPRLATGIAAAALLLVAGFLFFQPDAPDVNAQLTADEMSEYIAAHIDEFELEMLVEVAETELPDLEQDEELDQYLDEIIDEMDLEDLEKLF